MNKVKSKGTYAKNQAKRLDLGCFLKAKGIPTVASHSQNLQNLLLVS